MDGDRLLELERIGDRTWPALERFEYDGWVVRFAAGVTRRSNSVTPLRPSSIPLEVKIDAVESRFVERGLTPTFRLTDLAEPGLEPLLARRAYVPDLGAHVMTCPLSSRASVPAAGVRIQSRPNRHWLAALSAFGDDRGNPKVMEALLGRVEDGAYASIEESNEVVAIGMAVPAAGWVAVFNMNTRHDRRRSGLGRSILGALLDWGSRAGADEAFLQVHPKSSAAIALYRAEGFDVAYTYRYRALDRARQVSAV